LEPTRIYKKIIFSLMPTVNLKAIAHITGGGLSENLPRVIPEQLCAEVNRSSWRWPDLFHWLQSTGKVETREMYRTFNCGIGMVVIVGPDEADATLERLQATGERAWRLGAICQHDGNRARVTYLD